MTVTKFHDAGGNVQSKKDARGVVTSFTYDGLNRLTSKSYTDALTSPVSMKYDSASVANGLGRLGSTVNGSASNVITGYDAMGRVTGSSQTLAGQTYTFGYGYDLAGSLTSEVYPSGRTVEMGYDAANRTNAVGIAGDLTRYAQGITYAPHGALAGATLGSASLGKSIGLSYTYDARLRPALWGTTVSNNAAAYLQQLGYQWYANGDLETVNVQSGNGVPVANLTTVTQSFKYDSLNRLKSFGGHRRWGDAQ